MGFLWRRRSRKPFKDYLSPEAIAKLLRETKSEIKPPEVKHFQFVVIVADDTNSQDVPAVIRTLMSTLVCHHANILNAAPPLFVALLGVPFLEGNSPEARQNLVDALFRESGNQIKIAHGECDAAVGLFGVDERCIYGALIPGLSGILRKLLEAEFGSETEVS